MTWSPDGKWLASGSDDSTIRIWNVSTGESQNTLRGHRAAVQGVAWEPAGARLASAGGDGCVKLWNPFHRADMREYLGRAPAILSPDGRQLIANSTDELGVARIFDAKSGRVEREIRTENRARFLGFSWSPTGNQIAAVSTDGFNRVWDAATGRESWSAGPVEVVDPSRLIALRTVDWSPDGRLIASAGSDDRKVRIWEPATGRLVETLAGYQLQVGSLCWCPDGRKLATKDWYQNVKVWNTSTWQDEFNVRSHPSHPPGLVHGTDGVHALVWSADGKSLAVGTSLGWIIVWDLQTGREQLSIRAHSTNIRSIAWSRDGTRMASASTDHTIKIWDVATGQELLSLNGGIGQVYSVEWAPDGRSLVSAGSHAIQVWDASKGYDNPP